MNGEPFPVLIAAGTFASVHRTWKNGDRIVLKLPMSLAWNQWTTASRTVALLFGPLFFLRLQMRRLRFRTQLLAATGREGWRRMDIGSLGLGPFRPLEKSTIRTT